MRNTEFTDLGSLEERVRHSLVTDDLEGLRMDLQGQHPADLADLLDRLPTADRVRVFTLLNPECAAEVLDEAGGNTTRTLLTGLPPERARELLHQLPIDDVIEILTEDVPDQREALLAGMESDEVQRVRELLVYPPQSVGRLMTGQFVRVRPELTVEETITLLREKGSEIGPLTELYVLDAAGNLIGAVPLRALVTSDPQHRLSELMTTDLVMVTTETDQEEAARLVSRYDLLSLPVVGPNLQLLGVVTVDDVIDVLVREDTEDALRFGAIEGPVTDESYFSTPVREVIRRRIGWLLILFVTGSLTINVLGRFEEELDQVVALAFFIPLLIGTGGNTGAQTVSTMVRSMALGEILPRDARRVVTRELAGGLLLGVLLSIVALGFALLLGHSLDLALVVALAVIAICTWANTIGALVPLVARRLGLDPALVSAPLITTVVDATGLMIYLLLAKVLLGL